jgi:FdhD protein
MGDIKQINVKTYKQDEFEFKPDFVAVEEPLEIRIVFGPLDNRLTKQVAINMRTPTDDENLAIGFLYNEGIIDSYNEILKISKSTYQKGELNENILTVALKPTTLFDMSKLNRNFYTTSSCGICGKASIEAIQNIVLLKIKPDEVKFNAQYILELPAILRAHQKLFTHTGGIHGVALFNKIELIHISEDVGRHNAMDKLTGMLLRKEYIIKEAILLLSGRASYELLQKAAMNGISVVCAVGAPSSLAIDIAHVFGTLIGFLREKSFNIYTHGERIVS